MAHVLLRPGSISRRGDYFCVDLILEDRAEFSTSFKSFEYAAREFFRLMKTANVGGVVAPAELQARLEQYQSCIQRPRRRRGRSQRRRQGTVPAAGSMPALEPHNVDPAATTSQAQRDTADSALGRHIARSSQLMASAFSTQQTHIRMADSGDGWVQNCYNCRNSTRHGSGPAPNGQWICDTCCPF